jgi:hypothetical protein
VSVNSLKVFPLIKILGCVPVCVLHALMLCLMVAYRSAREEAATVLKKRKPLLRGTKVAFRGLQKKEKRQLGKHFLVGGGQEQSQACSASKACLIWCKSASVMGLVR